MKTLPLVPRIICIDVDEATCKERLFSRRFNVITGSEHNFISLSSDDSQGQTDAELAIHFKDYEIIVNHNVRRVPESSV